MAVALLQANLNHPWRVDELAREIALSSLLADMPISL